MKYIYLFIFQIQKYKILSTSLYANIDKFHYNELEFSRLNESQINKDIENDLNHFSVSDRFLNDNMNVDKSKNHREANSFQIFKTKIHNENSKANDKNIGVQDDDCSYNLSDF